MDNILFELLKTISLVGNEKFMLILATLISLVIIFWHKEEKLAGFILFNYGLTMTIVVLLKYLVHKDRNPLALVYESSYAFPSGHVAAAAVSFLLLFYLSRFVKNIFWRDFMKIFGIIWIGLMTYARLGLKVHDIYDILASIIIASFIFYLSLQIKLFKKGILKKEIQNLN
jgi:membrane-associated phospholipid phosphatase